MKNNTSIPYDSFKYPQSWFSSPPLLYPPSISALELSSSLFPFSPSYQSPGFHQSLPLRISFPSSSILPYLLCWVLWGLQIKHMKTLCSDPHVNENLNGSFSWVCCLPFEALWGKEVELLPVQAQGENHWEIASESLPCLQSSLKLIKNYRDHLTNEGRIVSAPGVDNFNIKY